MKIKSTLIKPFARRVSRQIEKQRKEAITHQKNIFHQLIEQAKDTLFGIDHQFHTIKSPIDFAARVPVREYEELRVYIDRIKKGEENILWPGRPKYFAKTSGTTSGAKYIPITKASMPNHFNTARNALFYQANRLNSYTFFDGKMIFLSGSPEMEDTNGIPTGRLSGIVNHAVPSWLRANQLPSYKTNCIEDWDAKIDAIIRETVGQKMTLISGIPPWVKDYFERLLKYTGKDTLGEVFPQLEFVVHGGVNFEPYRKAFDELIGMPYHNVETYPASEGFIAYQDEAGEKGLLLNTNSGIFFEFIPVSTLGSESPTRLTLEDVEVGVNYALLISSNAGLWAYNIGDTVEFVSLDPYRIRVTGRIAHFISAFGEHVIAKEIEEAILTASDMFDLQIAAFTVAPRIAVSVDETSYHQWIIEANIPSDRITELRQTIDASVQGQNSYYEDLRKSGMLTLPEVVCVAPGTFSNYMRSLGKQGGQNKVPIVSNDRKIADGLLQVAGLDQTPGANNQ